MTAWPRRQIKRKQHTEFVTLTANNAVATELLKLAVNRLNKLIAPKLYRVAPKAELSTWMENKTKQPSQLMWRRVAQYLSACTLHLGI